MTKPNCKIFATLLVRKSQLFRENENITIVAFSKKASAI